MRFIASPRPIRTVLVANRGEIARRIMRTCRRLGIRTIAVHSDADRHSPHVRDADHAVGIGAASAKASYLNMDVIIAAALRAGADAIHPGYGFLSENAEFVRRCEAAGLIFVGPSERAVAHMGSKIESKGIAQAAGVRAVPGYHGSAQDAASLSEAAAGIGFPVILKASAGGGGRGMRRVDRLEDFDRALVLAKAEAQAAFGDGSLLIEKFLTNPRHLEVQLAGDRTGNLVHLYERDCSIQRNNQKLIEEAPAPNLPQAVRTWLHEAALKLGRAIGYDSVGTVEFIMDAHGSEPCFLEMNTRLQVEHPVTELITGVDLVEWQLIAAAGETLPLVQAQIPLHGHAIEARITAERADRAFQPSTGRLSCVQAPAGVRLDTGVETGSVVDLHYDSLLAKLIAHGNTRAAAVERLTNGLNELVLLGLPTSQPFLRDALRTTIFAQGRATTGFIQQAFPEGWQPAPPELAASRVAAVIAWASPLELDREREFVPEPAPALAWSNPWRARSGVRVTGAVRPASVLLHLEDDYGQADVELLRARDRFTVVLDGQHHVVPLPGFREDGSMLVMALGERSFAVRRQESRVEVFHDALFLGASIAPVIDLARGGGVPEKSGNDIEAPLHGVVSEIHVALGEEVEKGTPVAQMEAMKLVHSLVAQAAGKVTAIHFAVGDTVPAGAVLLVISPPEAKEEA